MNLITNELFENYTEKIKNSTDEKEILITENIYLKNALEDLRNDMADLINSTKKIIENGK